MKSLRRRPRALVILSRGVAALLLTLVAYAVLAPTGRYLAQAGWEEGRILARRQPIARLIDSPATDPATRAKLSLVSEARAFAADSVGLRVGQSFTSYTALDRDTLVLVLSAAERDALRFHTWWFPIVGRVPYKGYFDFAAARRAAQALERDSLDTVLRPAAAFSTLGWFNDPLLSSTLSADSVSLTNTVIHELTHNTFYAPGQAVFNESFANFVGSRGAEWFFRSRADSLRASRARTDWEREKILGRFWAGVYSQLDSAFRANPESRAARLAARDTIFAHSRAHFAADVLPLLPGIPQGTTVRLTLDNATVMSRRVYRTGLDDFDAVLEREGNVRRAATRIMTLARSRPKDPYAAVRSWLASAGAEAPAH